MAKTTVSKDNKNSALTGKKKGYKLQKIRQRYSD